MNRLAKWLSFKLLSLVPIHMLCAREVCEKLEKATLHVSWRHYAVLSLLQWTIFSQAGPLLVTKIVPAGPVFVDQKWFSQTIFHL